MGLTAERRQVTQAAALGARHQAIDDLTDDERRERAVIAWRVDQPHKPRRGVEQVRVERADIDRFHAVIAVRLHEARLQGSAQGS